MIEQTKAEKALYDYRMDFTIDVNINWNVPDAKPQIVKVPVYRFIEKYLWITNKDGKRILFHLNDDQIMLYREICLQRRAKKPVRINILKARQIGFSTFIAALIFVVTIFRPGQTSTIVADIAEHATTLFNKYKFFYNNLPQQLKLPMVKSNAKEVGVEYPDHTISTIRITTQGDASGRGSTNQCLHLSECAFWKDFTDTTISLQSTVSNTNLDSIIFYETTANGLNEYKDAWDKAVGGDSAFKALFFSWHDHPDYQKEWDPSYQLEQWETELQEKEKLTLEQMSWYHNQYLEFNKDREKLRQEFPSNPIEAFVVSGYSVFNAELIQKRKLEVFKTKDQVKQGFFTFKKEHSLDGSQISIKDIQWVDSKNGAIKIYEKPIKGYPYVVCNDPAMGGEDYYATQVFNNATGHQVAAYHKNKIDADDCAYQMYCLAVYYNNAMITGETNTTSYILQMCMKCGYKFIYQDQDIEDLGQHFFNKLGYKTKPNNRNQMIDMFKIAFRDDYQCISDWDTLCEMETFQVVRNSVNGKEKIEASGNNHDDLVMACCGYYMCRGMQSFVPTGFNMRDKDGNYRWDPFRDMHLTPNHEEINTEEVYQIWD